MKKILILLFWANSIWSSNAQNISVTDSARLFLQSYNYSKALQVINQQLNPNNNNVNLLILKGTALKGLLKYPEVIYTFEWALGIDSSGYQTYMGIALCHKALSNYNKALSNFKKAKALNPENIVIPIEIAGILYVSENYEQANTLINRFIGRCLCLSGYFFQNTFPIITIFLSLTFLKYAFARTYPNKSNKSTIN
ncbi:MAG: hypothetical protein Q8928_12545 [Bacteroidota bacterium]|nr:hypothetical protein [Bacteroidota bacterium]